MDNTSASYSGGPGFKSRPGDQLSLIFVVFLSHSRKILDSALNQATTASFQVHSYSSFAYHAFIRRYIIWVTEMRRQINYVLLVQINLR
jgi:hypothetical protein